MVHDLISEFNSNRFLLTEGAVGQRIEHEHGLSPDGNIFYAPLIYDPQGREALQKIYCQYLRIAQNYDIPILLMTNTRRANRERMQKSGFKDKNVMYDYAVFIKALAAKFNCSAFIGGMMGCRGGATLTAELKAYQQIMP